MPEETNLVFNKKAFQPLKIQVQPLKLSCLAALRSFSLQQVLSEAAAHVLTVFCPPDSENSYTLSCGVPMQHGKAQPRRNSTLPSCSGGCCPACPPFPGPKEGGDGPWRIAGHQAVCWVRQGVKALPDDERKNFATELEW